MYYSYYQSEHQHNSLRPITTPDDRVPPQELLLLYKKYLPIVIIERVFLIYVRLPNRVLFFISGDMKLKVFHIHMDENENGVSGGTEQALTQLPEMHTLQELTILRICSLLD